MSDLPDIDTNSVSFIAYWNVEDDGGLGPDQWSVDEVTSDGNITSQTLYDNGIEGGYTLVNGASATFRVKSDGWFIVYLDRSTSDMGKEKTVVPQGPFSVLNDHSDQRTADQISANALERAINSLRQQLGNSGATNYAAADVGLYTYQFPDATTTTCLSRLGSSEDGNSTTIGMTYTSDTDVYRHWFVAGGEGDDNATYGSTTSLVDWNGERLVQVSGYDNVEYGAISDELYSLAPDPGTEYTGELHRSGHESTYWAKGTNLLVWG